MAAAGKGSEPNPSSARRSGSGGCEELGFEHVGVEGPGEEEALGLVDVLATEMVHLAGGLDAFGEGLEPEVLAELDEGPDERLGFR